MACLRAATPLATGSCLLRRQAGQPVLAPRAAAASCRRRSWTCHAAEPRDEDLLISHSVCPVPQEQQPIYELKSLQDMFLFDWATLPAWEFTQKLLTTWAAFFLAMAMPISLVTFDIQKEPLQCLASASAGSMFITIVLVWRMYLGWQHVGDRLISATVEYEETGWYDGQVWVKTPQVLMRDRLQCTYLVKPAVARLKRTLIGLGGALVASVALLVTTPPPQVHSAAADYALTSSSRGSSAGQQVYLDSLQRFEPWALEQEEAGSAEEQLPPYSMQSHMMGAPSPFAE